MSSSPPVPESFQEIFCAQYAVPPDLYGVTVLRLTLYPHARWLAGMNAQKFLAPDRSFIATVGRLTRWRGFAGEVHEFQCRPENGRFWRRRVRLRVSVNRMRLLFSEVMGRAPSIPSDGSRLPDETRTEPSPLIFE
jgi:hypothetical protein